VILYDAAILSDPSDYPWSDLIKQLKPGAYCIALASPLTYPRLACAVEDAGFEIRDQILWITEAGVVPIVMARKPLETGTVASNVLKWGVGAINIDACRIDLKGRSKTSGGCAGSDRLFNGGITIRSAEDNSKGRWPANLILDQASGIRLDLQTGNRPGCKSPSLAKPESKFRPGQGNYQQQGPIYPGDGGASRFFQSCDSQENLMDYFSKMILPAGGIAFR
jgi:site-specific DNA-methyltransferase (adenine-specific)